MSWIKLYRDLLDSDFWASDEPFTYRSAFIHVLLSANWKDGVSHRNGHIVQVQRGQWLTSICKLAETFHWDRKKVYKWLRYMDAAGMITAESYNFGTTLTVVNYGKYQDGGSAPTTAPTTTVTTAPTTTVTTAPTTTVTTAPTTRYKNIEYRKEKEESILAPTPAIAGGRVDPDQGSVDQADDDDGYHLITAEEVEAVRNGTLHI